MTRSQVPFGGRFGGGCRRACLLGLVCLFWTAYSPEGSAGAPDASGTAPTAESVPAVAEAAWSAMIGRNVEISLRDGTTVVGTLERADGPTVVVIRSDGEVVSIDKVQAAGLRVPTSAAVPVPPPAAQPSQTPTPAPTTPPAGPERPPRHWARGGAITGFVTGGLTAMFGFASEGTLWASGAEQIPALPLGTVATVIAAVGTPIAAAGGKSARRASGVRGNPGARITAWVFYGAGLTNAVVLIGLGVAEVTPFPGQISLGTVLLSGSGILMGVDALKAARQSRAAFRATRSESSRWNFGYTPLRAGRSLAGGLASVGGRF